MFTPHELSGNRLLVLALGAALILSTQAAYATDADIPRTPPQAGHESAQHEIELAAAYFMGRGVMRDEKQAAYWYEKAAEAGDPEAQKQIGYFYETGLGVPADPARAAHWYQLAAANGLLSAKVNLGVAYLMGEGVAKNPEFGKQLFLEAAAKGSGLAACYLGEMYFFGIDVNQDQSAARHWYEVGTKLHDPQAAFRLASVLYGNAERDRNWPKVADSLRKSADEGYVPAMHALGYLLVNQPSLTSSPTEAIAVLNQASAAGYWKSSAMLGVLARKGTMAPVDLNASYYDFRLATLQGGDQASQLLTKDLRILADKLGPAEASKLDARAQDYFQQHHEVLEFVYKDGEKWKMFPAFALAAPEAGSYAGKLIPTHNLN